MKVEAISVALGALAALLLAGPANAQTFRMVPSVSLGEAYTDNISLVPDPLAHSGWITELTPQIKAELKGARVKGFLDFRLQTNRYSSESRLDGTQHFLNSFAKVEAVEQLVFVDARAGISQQNRTPFGVVVAPDASSQAANRVETTAYQVSPYVRGHYSDVANYLLRYIESRAETDDLTLPDTRTSEWVAKVGNATRSAKLGWSIDANALRLRNDVVGVLDNARVRGSLIYAVNPQLHLSLIEGYEKTDFAGPPRRENDTPGVGLEWSPGVRTQLSAVFERRFFGNGYNAIFSHRTPRTAWRFVGTRDAAVLPTQLASSSVNSIESLMSELLTSAIPDPEQRQEAVKRRLEEYGFPGSSALGSDFLTARPFLFRSNVASVALLGATNTLTLTISNREQRSFGVDLGSASSLADDNFRQNAYDLNFAHKLTPLTSVTLSATRLKTEGVVIAARQTTQESYRLYLTTRLGPKTTASIGIRHVDFSTSTVIDSYRENIVFGVVSVRM